MISFFKAFRFFSFFLEISTMLSSFFCRPYTFCCYTFCSFFPIPKVICPKLSRKEVVSETRMKSLYITFKSCAKIFSSVWQSLSLRQSSRVDQLNSSMTDEMCSYFPKRHAHLKALRFIDSRSWTRYLRCEFQISDAYSRRGKHTQKNAVVLACCEALFRALTMAYKVLLVWLICPL